MSASFALWAADWMNGEGEVLKTGFDADLFAKFLAEIDLLDRSYPVSDFFEQIIAEFTVDSFDTIMPDNLIDIVIAEIDGNGFEPVAFGFDLFNTDGVMTAYEISNFDFNGYAESDVGADLFASFSGVARELSPTSFDLHSASELLASLLTSEGDAGELHYSTRMYDMLYDAFDLPTFGYQVFLIADVGDGV